MTHDDMTPTERQAAIIADLEARVTLLTDDLFYARASVARMTVELEQANRKLEHRDAEIAMLRAASDKADTQPPKRPSYRTPRTDAHVNQLATHLVHPHWITFARELEHENAALREDKERLDWLEKQCVFLNLQHSPGVYSRFLTTRDEIDAERKEAQP